MHWPVVRQESSSLSDGFAARASEAKHALVEHRHITTSCELLDIIQRPRRSPDRMFKNEGFPVLLRRVQNPHSELEQRNPTEHPIHLQFAGHPLPVRVHECAEERTRRAEEEPLGIV